MCGIAGIYAPAGSCGQAQTQWLRRVSAAMAARGPDGCGEWAEPRGRALLAHRRLAIIDLADHAAQPMQSADGRLVISFNGEIYNHAALRQALQARGHVFRTQSDTEVLLAMYRAYGVAMLTLLRGMFAFALWDADRNAMLLARDPFGIKPLFYGTTGGQLRFASRVKPLLAGGGLDTTPEPAGHAGFFLWGAVPQPWTLYKGIRALAAGHYLWATAEGQAQPTEYCSVPQVLAEAALGKAHASQQQALADIADAIQDSVGAHHVADVPVGVFQSAGIDSSLLTAMSSAQVQRTRTLTLAFAEFRGTDADESVLAAHVAREFGTQHTTATVGCEEFLQERTALLRAMDQPTVDGVNTWFVSRAAAAQGMKVVLSGLGADELFGSYPSFRDIPRMRALVGPLRRWPAVGVGIRRLLLPWIGKALSPKFASVVELGGTIEGAYLLRRCLHLPAELGPLIGERMAREGLEALQWQAELQRTHAGIADDPHAIAALEMSWYMRNQLLADTDWASMAHSLEVRVPFVDLPLLRRVIPWQCAFPALTKAQIARAAAPRIPAAVTQRGKTGFCVPVRDWLLADRPQDTARGLRGWAGFVHASFTGAPA